MKTISLEKFTEGVNNIDSEINLSPNSLREANNVDITNEGSVKRRYGYSKIYSGTDIHSLYKNYFVEEGTVKELLSDNTAVAIVSGVGSNRLSFCESNSIIYFSNETANGTLTGPLGIEDIPIAPTVSEVSGTLVAGNYQVSICYADEEQGGAIEPIVISIGNNSAIQINNIVGSSMGYDTLIFISTPDGSELYECTRLPSSAISYTYSTTNSGKVLDTLFMKQIPTGQIIRAFKGRLYIASGSTLYYTEAHRYGLYTPSNTFFNFPERITVLQETDTGLFIVADKTYFLNGTNPKDMTLKIISNDTGVEGTGISTEAENFNIGFQGLSAYWFGSQGAVLGEPNGTLMYLSRDKLNIDITTDIGTTGYREKEGIRQLITNLFEQSSDGSAFSASDNVIAQVIRNGVVI